MGALDDLRAIVREESGSAAMVQAINGMSALMGAYLPYLVEIAGKELSVMLDGKQVGKGVTKYITSTQNAKLSVKGG